MRGGGGGSFLLPRGPKILLAAWVQATKLKMFNSNIESKRKAKTYMCFLEPYLSNLHAYPSVMVHLDKRF